MSTGGDDRERYEEDWFEEPGAEPGEGFRDPEAETWLEEPPERRQGPGDRRPLIVALAVAVALILAGVGIARVVGGGNDETSTPPAASTATSNQPGTETAGTGTTASTTPAVTVPGDATLKSGDEGDAVKRLQQALAALGYDVGTPDGVFGPGTQEALKQFQADSGLDADGVAGPATLSAINEALASG